jgi:hypothetical protein
MSNQFYRHFRTWRAKIHCGVGLEVWLASEDIHVAGVGHVKPVTITWRTLPGTYRYRVTRSLHLAYCLYHMEIQTQPIPVALRSNVPVCGHSLAGIVGSNPVDGMDVCLLCLVSDIGLCEWPIPRPQESYRVCVSSVISCNNNPLHLHLPRVGRRCQTKKEEHRKSYRHVLVFYPCVCPSE